MGIQPPGFFRRLGVRKLLGTQEEKARGKRTLSFTQDRFRRLFLQRFCRPWKYERRRSGSRARPQGGAARSRGSSDIVHVGIAQHLLVYSKILEPKHD